MKSKHRSLRCVASQENEPHEPNMLGKRVMLIFVLVPDEARSWWTLWSAMICSTVCVLSPSAELEVMVSFIDEHRADCGVESICKQLPIAPSTCYECKAKQRDPERLSDRAKRDAQLEAEIQRRND